MIEKIKQIAWLAGEELMKYHGQSYDIKTKNNDPKNLMTEADKASEKLILSELKKSFPEVPVLSEEKEQNIDLTQDFFLVDPLDGTRQFVNKTSNFTVNIAFCKRGEPVIGVLYLPATKRMYSAEKNKGAFVNDLELSVSNFSSLDSARVIDKVAHHKSKGADVIDSLKNKIEIDAATGLKICLVAQGVAEVFINSSPNTSKWDLAASHIILEEAGGKITDFSGGEIDYTKPSTKITEFIATNGNVHRDILRLFKKISN